MNCLLVLLGGFLCWFRVSSEEQLQGTLNTWEANSVDTWQHQRGECTEVMCLLVSLLRVEKGRTFQVLEAPLSAQELSFTFWTTVKE